MKAIKTIYLTLVLAGASLASCTSIDYPDRFQQTAGVPTIHFVRMADQDVAITQGSLDQTVCIVGDNLTSVHDIYFNDQKAILNTSFMTAHTILVAIPRNLPTVETDEINFITKDSTVVKFPFKVLAPAPKITSMNAEWAAPGDQVTIKGSYFTSPMSVKFPGVDEIELTTVPSMDEVTVTVPEGAQPGRIVVTTDSGSAQSVFMYKDTRGMLFNFDDARGNHGWHPMVIETSDLALDGKYLLLYSSDGLKSDGTDWPDGGYHFEYWAGNWNTPETYDDPDGIDLNKVVDFSSWQNLALKFELMIPASDPWKGTPMQIWFAGHNFVTMQTANNTYFHQAAEPGEADPLPRIIWKPWKGGAYHTNGKWITVSFPLQSEMIWAWFDGDKATEQPKVASFCSFEIFVAAGSSEEGEASAPKMYIDNIRVVPIK